MVPHCYEEREAVEPFLKKAKEQLPFLAYLAIHDAYIAQDKMFKVVALTHLKNYFKKTKIAEETFKELVRLLDTFRDPYEDFLVHRAARTWTDIKNNILGGLL